MITCWNLLSKYGDFKNCFLKIWRFWHTFFLAQNSFVEVTVDIFLVTKWQKFTKWWKMLVQTSVQWFFSFMKNLWFNSKQGLCRVTRCGLAIYICHSRQKKNYGNSNISPCKNIPNLQKSPPKETKIFQDIITLL